MAQCAADQCRRLLRASANKYFIFRSRKFSLFPTSSSSSASLSGHGVCGCTSQLRLPQHNCLKLVQLSWRSVNPSRTKSFSAAAAKTKTKNDTIGEVDAFDSLTAINELQLQEEHEFIFEEFGGEVTRTSYVPGVVSKQKHRRGGHIDEAATLAEIDALLFSGNVDSAIQSFNRCRRKGHKFDVSTFNSILHGLAAKKRLLDFQVFFHNMVGDHVQPNVQTYCATLELYGRLGNADLIKETCEKLQSQGFRLQHIFQNAVLTKEQVTQILEAIRSVYPEYKAEVHIENELAGISPLVQQFYNEMRKDLNDFTANNTKSLLGDAKAMFEEQLERERLGFYSIQCVNKKDRKLPDDQQSVKTFSEIQSEWKERLAAEIEKEIELVKSDKKGNKRHKSGPFTRLMVPCNEYAELAVEAIVGPVCSQSNGAPLNYLCWLVGTQVYNRYAIKMKEKSGVLDKIRMVYEEYVKVASDSESCKTTNPRDVWQHLEKSLPYEGSIYCDVPPWPASVRVLVGCTIIDLLIKETTIDGNLLNNRPERVMPAFYHTYEYERTTVSGYIKAHPTVVKLYQKHLGNSGEISLPASKLPMLVPPRPWTSITHGGHLLFSVQLARGQDKTYENLHSLQEAHKKSKLNAIYDSLNCLGLCAWKVDSKMLDIMIDIFNDKGSETLGIPGPDLPQIPEFRDEFTHNPEMYSTFLKEKSNAKKLCHEAHALRMAMLYHLSVANHFRDKTFWMPCNLDFRGRAYPIPPYGSHVGDDPTRGVLRYAMGRPLGPTGLDWLKIHLVNLRGKLKKATLQERIESADAHMDDIHDSADNPLTGKLWWQTADEKWQVLSTCMEISNAVRSGDPENFVSHLPVHQDGSCNGLQHYAALGLDEYGGKQVNVLPSARPEDVYSEVAKLVEKMCERDAANGVEIAQQLLGNVSRKVVKQTVMTLVYGVTFIGGRKQISGQLDDLGLPASVVWKGSSYLTRNVFASIREMFSAAKDIQDWFTASAAQIALSGHCVDWVTPLNLPVIQSYQRMIKREISTPLQLIKIRQPAQEMLPNLVKQKGGFPPNFIHSLDSCHMMLTALYCKRLGLNFTSVHDSFWTHACDLDAMNKVCREQFVSLHSQPILEDLRNHFIKKFEKKKMRRPLRNSNRDEVYFEPLPARGSLDLNQVLDSTYFFS